MEEGCERCLKLTFIYPYGGLYFSSYLSMRYCNLDRRLIAEDGGLLFCFDNCVLDTERRELRRGGDLVSLEPQVFDLLEYLIRNREHVVSKDDVLTAVWKGRAVSESALTTRINAARGAVGDTGGKQSLIRTLRRKGIRFIGTVRESHGPAADVVTPLVSVQPAQGFALPDRPSIAVLPFVNMSGDPDQDHFADGIVEDIITALSHIRSFFVIARSSTFTYKGQAIDIRRVARELGVQYVLEGSVRRVGDQVRITVQLIEAESATHIWSRRYDRAIQDIFALQDEITDSIAGALEPEISASERTRARRKHPDSLGAWELYQHGMWHLLQQNHSNFLQAETFFLKAATLDPTFAAAHAGRSLVIFFLLARMLKDGHAPGTDAMFEEAARAVDLDPNDALGHVALGLAHIQKRQISDAMLEHEESLELNPSSAFAHWSFGHVLIRADRFEQALEHCEAAIRLSPRDPVTWMYVAHKAGALYHLRRYEESAKWAREAARHRTADLIWPHIRLAGASAYLGLREDAAAAIAELRRKKPGLTITSLLSWPHMQLRSRASLDHIVDGLRQAGLPE
jgi:TolB-like protein